MNTLCPPKSKLQSLSHGLLSEEESGELLRHLDGCDSCQHAIESVDSAKDSLIHQIRIGEDGATHTFENEADCKIAGMKRLSDRWGEAAWGRSIWAATQGWSDWLPSSALRGIASSTKRLISVFQPR